MVYYIFSSDSNNSIRNPTCNVNTLSGTVLKQPHKSIPIYLYNNDRSNIDEFYTPAESKSNICKKHAHHQQPSLETNESNHTYNIETKKCYCNVYDVFTNSCLLQNKLPGSICYHKSHAIKVPLHTESDVRNLKKQIEFSMDKAKQTRERKQIENKCDRAEKATYCRPVTEYHNEEYLYKTLADKKKLQNLLKKMIKDREKDKRKAVWNDYIHQLKMKYMNDETQPTTSKTLNPPDTGFDMDIIEDCYNTRFRIAPSDHCKTLLRDLYSSSIDNNKFPIRSYANANLFFKNNQNDYTCDKKILNSNQCGVNPDRNGAIDNNPSSSTNNSNPYLPITSQNPYTTYPCSSSGRLMKLNKLTAFNSCDLGIPKRRLIRYNNKSYQKSRNNNLKHTKYIRARFESSEEQNRANKNKLKSKTINPRQRNSTRSDDLVEIFTERRPETKSRNNDERHTKYLRGRSEASQEGNREHENNQMSKFKYVSPKQQIVDDSVEVTRQNKLNTEREKETNLNRNRGVNTILKIDKSNATFSSSVEKSNHERETKMTPSLDQNSLKNIEDKLDILITQMNALLGKSKLLNSHHCPCKINNIEQSVKNIPINKEGTCCRTRKLQMFSSEESKAFNFKISHNNRNDATSYIEQKDASNITEETTDISEEYTAPHTYSHVDISDGNKKTITNNSNNKKIAAPNIVEEVNETKDDSHKNDIVSNKNDKLIFVTISSKSTSTFEGSGGSVNVSKIDEILLEEMNKSDKLKRDIEGILNGNKSNPFNLPNIFEEPTRDCGTEVTKSLSKARIEEDSSIESTEVVTVYDNNPNERLTMAVNTDPLGLLSLLKISTATIGRLLNFVNFDYQSLLPLAMPRPLNRPPTVAFNCTMCNSSFQKSTEFSDHIRSHKAQSSKDCCVCRHMLEKRVNRMHRSSLFSCRYCKKSFTRAYCCELHEQHCSRRQGMKHDLPENLAILS